MKIVLIGFMGSGKTSVAKAVAKKLNLKFIDMDETALNQTYRKSVNEIFEKDGEEKFREIELEVASKLEDADGVVISTGGGVIMNPQVMKYLTKNASVYYLKANFDKLKVRVEEKEIRPPLFRDVGKARQLFNKRAPLYEHYANVVIVTDNKSVDEIVGEITNGRQ